MGRAFTFAVLNDPIVDGPVVLKLQCADGVCHALVGVLERVSEVVHRIDAPLVACAVMALVHDSIYDGVAHIEVWRSHVYFRPQNLLTVFVFSLSHFSE